MLKVLELFGGIGACTKALKRLGIEHEVVDYVEIDKYAVKSYNAINGTNFEPQDITKWDKDIEVDLIMHGSPCQDFSLAGLQMGGDENSGTRSSLMFETLRIVQKLNPRFVIWENVKNVLSKKHIHNFESYLAYLEQLGYTNYYKVLNAKDYGVPQHRERIFCVSIMGGEKECEQLNLFNFSTYNVGINSFKFPNKKELKIKLKDLLEQDVDDKYYLTQKGITYICGNALNKDLKDVYDRSKALFNKDTAYTLNTNPTRRCGDSNYVIDGLGETSVADYLKLKQGVIVRNQGKEIVRETEVANTLMTRDYKGFGNQDMKGVIACNSVEKTENLLNDVENGKYNPNKAYGKYLFQSSRFDDKPLEEVSQTIKSSKVDCGVINNLRIRKLTPKECWRLMGFDDEDFEKAQQVNSNTQLYKQAGNSIVVNVLEAIFKELLKGELK